MNYEFTDGYIHLAISDVERTMEIMKQIDTDAWTPEFGFLIMEMVDTIKKAKSLPVVRHGTDCLYYIDTNEAGKIIKLQVQTIDGVVIADVTGNVSHFAPGDAIRIKGARYHRGVPGHGIIDNLENVTADVTN